MALSPSSVLKAREGLEACFPKSSVKVDGGRVDLPEYGADDVHVTVDDITDGQFLRLADLRRELKHSISIKRSGTKVRIGFF